MGLKIPRSKGRAGSIPASGTKQIKGLRGFLNFAGPLFFPQYLNLFRNSLGRRDLFAYPFADVVLGHHHSRMPKLISGLQDIPAGFGLVRTSLCA